MDEKSAERKERKKNGHQNKGTTKEIKEREDYVEKTTTSEGHCPLTVTCIVPRFIDTREVEPLYRHHSDVTHHLGVHWCPQNQCCTDR